MKRIVIKVGSAVLTHNNRLAKDRMLKLVDFIAEVKNRYEVILVSSGAVAAGYTQLKLDKKEIVNRQSLASIGQPHLMSAYQKKFDKHAIVTSQILLMAEHFDSRASTFNVRNMVDMLLGKGVLPIINENDSVTVKELTFGDNDQLSAYVAHYFNADLLVILSDIDAYYSKNPRLYPDAKILSKVHSIAQSELNQEVAPSSHFATGGIVTKLKAADFLLKRNCSMYLSSGMNLSNVRDYLIDGKQNGGTLFTPEGL